MTTATPVGLRRFLQGALIAAGLLLAAPGPAAAQNPVCGNKQCAFVYCWLQNGQSVCRVFWAGCYSTNPCPGCCTCPVSGGTCVDIQHAFIDNDQPTDEALLAHGTTVCHELIRERLQVERGVRLFDTDSSWASISGPGHVRVTGRAQPDGVAPPNEAGVRTVERAPARPFTCEVERNLRDEWRPVSLTLSEGEK